MQIPPIILSGMIVVTENKNLLRFFYICVKYRTLQYNVLPGVTSTGLFSIQIQNLLLSNMSR